MRVADMGINDIVEMCETRQNILGKKYEGTEKNRDWAKDVMEEVIDVINITRKHYDLDDKFKTDKIYIILQAKKLAYMIIEADKKRINANVVVSDTAAGDRPYFDYK